MTPPLTPMGQVLSVVRMLLQGVVNSLRRRQGKGAMLIFPLLLAFLLMQLAQFGSRATDGMKHILSRATPEKGFHYTSLWLTELFVAIVVLKYARTIPGRGSKTLFDQPLLRALPTFPSARLVLELGAGHLSAVGFVLLVWVPSVWGVASHFHPTGTAVALTIASSLAVNFVATLWAMGFHVVTSRTMGGRALDIMRVLSSVLGLGLVIAYSSIGPIGAGGSRALRVTPYVPPWSVHLPLKPLVRWIAHPSDLHHFGLALALWGVPSLVATAVLLRRLRDPSDLSLDAPQTPASSRGWETRLTPLTIEFRALARQAPYLPFATPGFLLFFLALGHGAPTSTGHDLPLIVLMGLTAWALVVLGTALSGALSRRWRRVLWIPSVLGRDHTDTIRAATAAHTFLTMGLAFSVFAMLLASRIPEPLWFVRMVVGLALCITAGQWLQVSTVFLLIDPAPDRLTGLSVGALIGVLATSLPTAALVVLLSATPFASWAALLFLLALTAWSIERAAVARLASIRDPDGDALAEYRSWPALRTFGIALITQVVVMQGAETLLGLSPSANLVIGYVGFALVAIPLGWEATRRHAPTPHWSHAKSIAVGLFAGIANFTVAMTYAHFVSRHLGGARGPLTQAMQEASPAWRIGLVLAAAFIGPIAEELFFRGWLLHALPYDLGPKRARWAPVLTAMTFAVLHAGEAWVPALTAGILAGWLKHRSGRIDTSLAMHITNNSLVMAGALGLLTRLGV